MFESKTKLFSSISTIIMTVYTVLLMILGISLTSGMPSSFARTSGYQMFSDDMFWAGAVIITFATIILSMVCITITAISYLLVYREYFKADAWMKIIVFGIIFTIMTTCTDYCGLQMFLMEILFVAPIVFSVLTLFAEYKNTVPPVCKDLKNDKQAEAIYSEEKTEE